MLCLSPGLLGINICQANLDEPTTTPSLNSADSERQFSAPKTKTAQVKHLILKPIFNFSEKRAPKTVKGKLKQALKLQYQTFKQATLPTSTNQQQAAYRETIEKVLLAEGYYQSQVALISSQPEKVSIQTQNNAQSNVENKTLKWRITTGTQYKINSITVNPKPTKFDARLIFPKKFRPNAALRAETVLKAQQALQSALAEHECLWRITVDYDVTLDHKTQRADITFNIAPSSEATFGQIQIVGMEKVPESYLTAQVDLTTGACFKRSTIRQTRLKLLNTGLLSQVDAQLTHDRNQGTVDVLLTVRERLHRSVSASIGYSIDEKGALSAGWTHRNFRQKANRLSVSGRYSSLLQSAEIQWTQPHVFGPNQYLNWEISAENEQIDAFDARNRHLSITSEHQLSQHMLASIGLEIARSDVIEDDIGKQFELISFPMGLTYDRRDDLLDPSKGWLGFAEANSFWNLRDRDATFQKLSIGLHHYVNKPLARRKLTLASRIFLASFTHKSTDIIPATEKFFAGGGGSVRGFAYKSLGPRSDNSDSADGGFSMLELSVELRYRISQNWGTVIFADAGNTWAERKPDLSSSLPQSAGIGARFFTGFVPIRLDLAFPTNQPKNLSEDQTEDYQFYISIGQAF